MPQLQEEINVEFVDEGGAVEGEHYVVNDTPLGGADPAVLALQLLENQIVPHQDAIDFFIEGGGDIDKVLGVLHRLTTTIDHLGR